MTTFDFVLAMLVFMFLVAVGGAISLLGENLDALN
jgi:hypothetical protein